MTKFQLPPVQFSCILVSSAAQKTTAMSFINYLSSAIPGPVTLSLSHDLTQSLGASDPHLETEVTSLLYKEVVEKNPQVLRKLLRHCDKDNEILRENICKWQKVQILLSKPH